jgi:hypothetical protein
MASKKLLVDLEVSGDITANNLSRTNTGDQTTITGNSGSATVLETARNINGVSFDGSANITVTADANLAGNLLTAVPSEAVFTDTVYTLPLATSTVRGGIELFSNTDNPTAANTVTSVASRTYGIQLNAANQAVVNVPWSDTNMILLMMI